MDKNPPKFTKLEQEIDELLSDGQQHSWRDIMDICRKYRDSEFTKINMRNTIALYVTKLKRIEPQAIVANSHLGRRIIYRKYRRYVP